MRQDIKKLRLRFVIIVVVIVAIILSCLFTVLYNIMKMSINRFFISRYALALILKDMRVRFFIIGLICVALFGLIAFILSKWVVKPVEKNWEEQKQFVNNASHELKTPLTVITTNAEMLQADCSEEDKKKYSNNILTVSRQMRSLVEDLLNLARIEKGEAAGFKKVNISEVFETNLLQFEPVMYELGLSLNDDIAKNIYVFGSEQRLQQLLIILLDNASKYSKLGTVFVKLQSNGHNAILSVANPSEPLTQQQLNDIFKRFYRTDESHTSKESFGLGLPIAKSICESHKGKIKAEYKEGYINFVVTLPIL